MRSSRLGEEDRSQKGRGVVQGAKQCRGWGGRLKLWGRRCRVCASGLERDIIGGEGGGIGCMRRGQGREIKARGDEVVRVLLGSGGLVWSW